VRTALEPAALPLSLEATTRLEQACRAWDRRWPQRLARAAYASERAARPYRLGAPAHRLVTRPLAQEGEAKLPAPR
jgi:hypothetical protein